MKKNRLFYLTMCLLCLITSVSTAQSNTPHFRERLRIERGGYVSDREQHLEAFAFSPDGQYLVAPGADNFVEVWDTTTGELVSTLPGVGPDYDYFMWAAYSPDGSRIAAGSVEGDLLIWDAPSGDLLATLDSMGSGAWSPDGSKIASAGEFVMYIYETESFELVASENTWGIIYQMAWSPDGSQIATLGGWMSTYLQLWNTQAELLDTMIGSSSIAWSPDGTQLASNYQIRDIVTRIPQHVIPDMQGALAWNPNGQWIASAYKDRIRLWDTATGQQVTEITSSECDFGSLAWSPDGTLLASKCRVHTPEHATPIVIWEWK